MTSNNTIEITKYGDGAETIRIGLSWEARKKDSPVRKAYFSRGAHISNILAIVMWPIGMIYRIILFLSAGMIWLTTIGRVNLLPKNAIHLPEFPSKKMLLDENVIYDINQERSEKIDNEKERENSYEYDLDLYCFAIKKEDGSIVKIGPENKNLITTDNTVFHSGEDTTGQGIFDDETIHIKLKEAQKIYSQFYIVVNSDSQNNFSNMDNKPTLRVIRSKEEQDILVTRIVTESDQTKEKNGYIFIKIYNEKGMWKLNQIDKFTTFVENFEDEIKGI